MLLCAVYCAFPVSCWCWLCPQATRCTVIGGGGFLGRHIVQGLLSKGYQVNVFDIRRTFDDDRISFFEGNLCLKEVSLTGRAYTERNHHCQGIRFVKTSAT